MQNLIEEVGACVIGTCIIFATRSPETKLVDNYISLIMMNDEKMEQGRHKIDII